MEVQIQLREEVVALVAVEGVIQEHHQVVQELQDKEMQAEEQAEQHVPLEEVVAVLVKLVNKVEQTVDLLLRACLMAETEQAHILLGVLLQAQA